MSYELFEENCDRRGSCGDELPSSSCATSYSSRRGIDIWVEPIQRRRVDHRRRTFSTSYSAKTCTSYPHSNVTSSPYGNDVGGRVGGSISHRSRENSLFQDVYDQCSRMCLHRRIMR
ncbi:hypothetical protein FXO37_27787 [Capsicum annuum]|nr:hypothetical protein FXO37_27787 [Capsicum annuum]